MTTSRPRRAARLRSCALVAAGLILHAAAPRTAEAWTWSQVAAPPSFVNADGRYEVTLQLQAPKAGALPLPVNSGVPLIRAAVRDAADLAIFDAAGQTVQAQFRPLAWWSDGSIKWVLVSFLAKPGQTPYVLKRLKAAPVAAPGIKVATSANGIVVDTGALRAVMSYEGDGFIDSLAVDADGNGQYDPQESLGRPAAQSFINLAETETRGRARAGHYYDVAHLRRQIELVESGPVRAVVKIVGEHANAAGRATAPYTVWLTFYAGQSWFEVWHTLVVAEPVSEVFIQSAGVQLALPRPASAARFGLEPHPVAVDLGARASVYAIQRDEATRRWPKLNDFRPAFRVIAHDAEGDRVAAEAERGRGWALAQCGTLSAAVCMARWWQEAPKELAVHNPALRLAACFWPQHQAEPLDLRPLIERAPPAFQQFLDTPQGQRMKAQPYRPTSVPGMGIAKSHELLCWLSARTPSDADLDAAAAALNQPRLLVASPEYYQQCVAEHPPFHLRDRQNFPTLDAALDDWCDLLIEHQTERFNWFGCLDYGDFPRSYHRPEHAWDCFGAGWLNGSADAMLPFFLEFMRTSQRRCFDAAAAGVRHAMDVDTLHAIDLDAPAALPCRPGPDRGAPGTFAHASPRALAMFYFLTGNPRAKAVLDELTAAAPPPDKLRGRALAQTTALAAVQAEMSQDPTARDRLAAYAKALTTRLRRIRVDTATGQPIDAETGRPLDADFDAFMLPALAYAHDLLGDADTLETLKLCVDAAWPAHPCLAALNTLFWLTKAPAYAKAIAYSLTQREWRPDRQAALWPEDALNPGAWPQLAQGLAALYDAKPPVQCEDWRKTLEARRHNAQAKTPQAGSFTPIDLAAAGNWSPFEPANCTDRPELSPTQADGVKLAESDLGFDFGLSWLAEPGFNVVAPGHVYPAWPGDPSPLAGFAALPFGATATYCGVPFKLAPKAVLLAPGTSVEAQIGRQVRKLHLLGAVCLRPALDNGIGARVTLTYADGDAQTIDLHNFEHYEPVAWPPAFVGAGVRLAAQLRHWHVNVLTLAAKPKPLSSVQLAAGEADHRVVILGLTVEHDDLVAKPEPTKVEWNLASLSAAGKSVVAQVPKGRYEIELNLASQTLAALDVSVCGQPRLRHVVVKGSMTVTLQPVNCDDKLTLDCWVRPLERMNAPSWDVSVAAVRRVGDIEGAADVPEPQTVRYGWRPGPDYATVPVVRAAALPFKPRTEYRPGRLFADGCAPALGRSSRTTFWVRVPNGRYEVRLYMRSATNEPCALDVLAEGKTRLEALKLRPALDGASYRKPDMAKFTVDVLDGRLDVDFMPAKPKGSRWTVCAMVVKSLK